ncbi:alkaline phosphatase [Candidatus Cetobacterium colombiensis]|uniref:Alkaline phosphatase n=1 Tax=Candidatus Cetobacterium colombiensis TaxID=3073100 RepID=A0ABU4W8U7_9FUSO|nr:alkaline phosphatase [Candidatus Cetobacterium colombiensis]MDX8335585.1 alkaline phosphatase [Candidatus Cetobacterium colombiensis]
MSKVKTKLLTLSAFLTIVGTAQGVPLKDIKPGFAKNVIFLIPDGSNVTVSTLARAVYNDGESLNIDEMASGMVKTYNSDTFIADSAPAGTALATGWKTQDKLIGVKPKAATLKGARVPEKNEELSPAASVLEAAKLEGKAVGIVATSEVLHATPADFTSHSIHRNNYSVIGEQQVHQNLNVVFGGGKSYLKKDKATEANSKKRTDNEDMLEALKANGYNIIETLDEMKSLNKDFVWGLFAEKDIPYDLDRDKATTPSLAEMTEKAIELLSKDQDGFFLMVEGSKVDWAGHANNPIAITSEYMAFDKAVGVALDYAKKNSDTLVVAVTDHGTGGLSIGNSKTSKNYPELPVDVFTKDMKKAKFTEVLTAEKIFKAKENASKLAEDMLGLNLTTEELDKITKAEKTSQIETILGNAMSERAHLAWTTNGHTGEDVPLYVYTSNYANQLTGTVNNSDIALYIAKAMNLDLDKATEELFVSGEKIKGLGIDLAIDTTDKFQPEFTLSKNGKKYKFHENKNYYETDGKKVKFNGIVVFNGKEVFIPQEAINNIK